MLRYCANVSYILLLKCSQKVTHIIIVPWDLRAVNINNLTD